MFKLNKLKKDMTEKIYKPKLVKSKHGWVVKGVLFSLLAGGSVFIESTEVQAAEWSANTSDQIKQRIGNDSKIEFIEGDTVYETANALNIKFDKLMAMNDIKMGEQYTLPIGTIIYFDGTKAVIEKTDGTKKEVTIDKSDKIDESKPVANQESDEVKNDLPITKKTSSSTHATSSTNGTTSTGATQNGQAEVPNSDSSNQTTKPNEPEKEAEKPTVKPDVPISPNVPEEPVKPEVPTIPDKPSGGNSELDTLTQQQAEKEQQLESVLATITDKENQFNEIQSQLNQAQTAKGEQDALYLSLTEKANQLQKQVESHKTTLADYQNQLNSLQQQMNEATDDETRQRLHAQVADITAKVNQVEQTITTLENQASEAYASANQAAAEKEAYAQQMNAYKNQLNLLQSEIADLKAQQAQLEDDIAALKEKIKQLENETTNEDNTLKDAKTIARDTLQALNLKGKLESFIVRINDATSIAQINDLLKEAAEVAYQNDQTDAQTNQIQKAKETAIDQINALNLTDADKTTFIEKVNVATTIDAINSILQDAANKANETNTEEDSPLVAAKKAALDTLNSLNLKDDKQTFIDQVNAAATTDDLNTILASAKAISAKNDSEDANQAEKDEQAKQLKEAKEAAIKTLNGLNLKTSKDSFIDKIEMASTIDEINAVLDDAKAISKENDAIDQDAAQKVEEARQLAKAKQTANDVLTTLNLKNDKQAFIDQISDAKTIDAVTAIVNDAKTLSTKNDADDQNAMTDEAAKKLVKAKTEALNTLANLNLQSELSSFVARITEATTLDAIKAIVDEATVVAEKNDKDEADKTEQAKKLMVAKQKAKEMITGLSLSSEQLQAFDLQIDHASSIDEVNAIVNDANATSDANDEAASNEAAAKLQKAKSDAITVINTLNLTSADKASFVTQLNGALTIDEVSTIQSTAQAKASENDANAIKEKELKAAKEAAITTINKLNLSNTDKQTYINQVNAVTVASDVQAVVDAAQAKSDATDKADKELKDKKSAALATLATLNLKENKDSFINQVNTATTTSEVDSILAEAKTQSAKNDAADKETAEKEELAKQLEQAKSSALTELNSLNLTDAQKSAAISTISGAKTLAELNASMADIRKQSEDNNANVTPPHTGPYETDYRNISKSKVNDVAKKIYSEIPSLSSKSAYAGMTPMSALLANDDASIGANALASKDYTISLSQVDKLSGAREINRRYQARVVENINKFRAELNLAPIEGLSQDDDQTFAYNYAHSLATYAAKNHITTYEMGRLSYINKLSLFSENMTPAEKIVGFGFDLPPEAIADNFVRAILAERTAYVAGTGTYGHLTNIMSNFNKLVGGVYIHSYEQTQGSGMFNKVPQYVYDYTNADILFD